MEGEMQDALSNFSKKEKLLEALSRIIAIGRVLCTVNSLIPLILPPSRCRQGSSAVPRIKSLTTSFQSRERNSFQGPQF
eukprot:1225928-Pleurochrysis_carterae.AAC.1